MADIVGIDRYKLAVPEEFGEDWDDAGMEGERQLFCEECGDYLVHEVDPADDWCFRCARKGRAEDAAYDEWRSREDG